METAIKLRKGNRLKRKEVRRHYEMLTRQEMRIMEHLRHGKTHKEIGAMMFISPLTVSTHVRNISLRLKVNKETALVDKYLHRKHGLIDFNEQY